MGTRFVVVDVRCSTEFVSTVRKVNSLTLTSDEVIDQSSAGHQMDSSTSSPTQTCCTGTNREDGKEPRMDLAEPD